MSSLLSLALPRCYKLNLPQPASPTANFISTFASLCFPSVCIIVIIIYHHFLISLDIKKKSKPSFAFSSLYLLPFSFAQRKKAFELSTHAPAPTKFRVGNQKEDTHLMSTVFKNSQ